QLVSPASVCNRPLRAERMCRAGPVLARGDLQHRPFALQNDRRRMKFNLLDKIEEISDTRVVAVKHVSLAEEYLADHFPTFPVLPGVLMLEALTQAAGWLLHHRRNFACSMVVLREARNVKYGHFVAPGNALRIDVELAKLSDGGATFKAAGSVGNAQALSARLE